MDGTLDNYIVDNKVMVAVIMAPRKMVLGGRRLGVVGIREDTAWTIRGTTLGYQNVGNANIVWYETTRDRTDHGTE